MRGATHKTKRGHVTLIAIENEPSAGNAPIDAHDYATTRVLKSSDKITFHRNGVAFEAGDLKPPEFLDRFGDRFKFLNVRIHGVLVEIHFLRQRQNLPR